MILTQLFCDLDDFCQVFIPAWEATLLKIGEKIPRKQRCLSSSEIMTLIVHYHHSGYKNFKWFYQRHLLRHLATAFQIA